MFMANLGDLSNLSGHVPTQTTTKDTIDLSKGKKLERNGTYVTPEEAKKIREEEAARDKEIFDTPPSIKIDPNMSVDPNEEVVNKPRTPITPGKPTDAPTEPGVHVVNNLANKVDMNSLQEFDISSLPSKPEKLSENEEYAMQNLDAAVEREKEAITARIHDLTEKQYKEYLDARAAGRPIPRPETNEEAEASLMAQIEAKDRQNMPVVAENPNEASVSKKIKIMDDDIETDMSVEKINKDKFNELISTVNGVVKTVYDHLMSKDYFDRAIHVRAILIEQCNVYAELWVIAMYDKDKNIAVHPFVYAKKHGIELCVECNAENIMGVHVLEENDTVEKVYYHLYNTGALYDYIDYLDGAVVFKMPIEQYDKNLAISMAKEIIDGGDPMAKSKKPVEDAAEKELDAAVKKEEAETLSEVVKDIESDEPKMVMKFDDDPVEEEASDFTELNLDEPKDDKKVYGYDIEPGHEGLTDEGIASIKQFANYGVEEKSDDVDGEVAEDAEWHDVRPDAKPEPEEEEEKVTLTRQYEGAAAYDLATSDDLKKDLEDEINENVDDDDDEKMLEELRNAVKENMPSIKNRINLRNFKIGSTPVAASKLAGFSIKDVNQADWILPNAKRVIEVRGLSGPELFAMNPQNSTKNRINTFRQIYSIIYRHIVSKKPKSFDEWLKVTRFSDIDHIYAALHRATFMDSNFTHYECPDCKHVFIKDHKWEDMVVYSDEKTKKQMEALYNSGDTSIADYEVELTQISDDYVIGLKDPSVWNMVMETSALSEEFLNKYEDLLDTMSFIDSIYVINRDSQTLDPVDFGYDAENPAKSTARKITILSDIIRTLSSDAYFDLRNKIATKFVSSTALSYQIPAADCPKCKHHFDPERVDAMQLLFTRHQLGAVGVISTTV